MRSTLIIVVTALVCLFVGFGAGMEFKAYQIRQALSTVAQSLTSESDQGKLVTSSDTIVNKVIGEEVVLATLNFKVNNVQEEMVLSGGFGSPVPVSADAKFVIVDLDVTNTTKAGFMFEPAGFRIIDDQGREFDAYEDTIGNVKNYLNVRNLSPDIAENGVIVFEIPKNATTYSLAVGKGGTNEIYEVKLK